VLLHPVHNLLQDTRFGLRILAKAPGFTAVAALTLALGIGANTAIFSVVNATLIHSLPYKDSDRIMMLWGNVRRAVVERRGASYPDYVDWRDRSTSFESMAAVWDVSFTLYGVDEPERVLGEAASAAYFPLLGIEPKLGRVFHGDEDRTPGAAPMVVLGEGLWKRRFGSDRGVIGQRIKLESQLFTVIGVLPDSFRGLSNEADFWIPTMEALSKEDVHERRTVWFPAVAKLKPGVSREQAQAELDAISRQLEAAYPATNEKRAVEVASLHGEMFGNVRPALLVLLAAVGLVLLIACANVTSLFLARAQDRQREIAIRAALGAGRRRLLQQLTVESLVLSLLGAVGGVLIAIWGVDALMAASPVRFPVFVKPQVDWTAIAFTVAVSLATGLAIGLAPALMAAGGDLHHTLKEASARASGARSGQRFRSVLVVAEVALALLLLVGAGLFIRSLQELARLDPGFRPQSLLTLSVSLPPTAPAARRIREALRGVPGVQEVALSSDTPLDGDSSAIFYTAEGQPPVNAQNMPRAYIHRVTPDFFRALGVRLVRGRDFTEDEMDGKHGVVIVSEGVARRFWAGQDPIGKRVKQGRPGTESPWWTIVGVVDEMKYRALPRNPTPDPDVYLPLSEQARRFAITLRTGVDPASVAGAVRNALLGVDKTAAVFGVVPMTQRVAEQMARARFIGWLMTIFAAAALLLAMLGIYGVIATAVAQRTQEIGIRMALGAARGDVLRMVAAQGLSMVGIGIAIGLAAAVVVTRVIQRLLFGVSPTDPLVFTAVALLLLFVALIATYLPARRATRVDPLVALRYE
jgi:predicted permease